MSNLFWGEWRDFPDYIIDITRRIWEGRDLESLNHLYAPDIPVRTPMGVARGNRGVIAATLATLAEFPDRQLLAEDVIWSDTDGHFLSSHRILSTGTHLGEGHLGPPTGKGFAIRVIADCAARAGVIDDEWLVRDNGGLVRQLGLDPRTFAARLIARDGPAAPYLPEADISGPYEGQGNSSDWGARYAEILQALMAGQLAATDYDRAAQAEHAGARHLIGAEAIARNWLALRAAFPSARFTIHHQIGRADPLMPPRAALRWSLDGTHDGWGAFGRPTGARVHVMGMAHAEFGPFGPGGIGLRRECALWDEIAIWKQILLHTGET
ncbi:MAG: ester cyclase [Roseinatronobacter sp.]